MRRLAAAAFAASFFLVASECLRHDGLLRHFSQLDVCLLFFLKRLGKKRRDIGFADGLSKRNAGAISGDLIVFDTLHAGDDHQIEDRTFFVVFLDLVLSLLNQSAHRFTDLAPWLDA